MWKRYNGTDCYKHFAATRRLLSVTVLRIATSRGITPVRHLTILFFIAIGTTSLAAGQTTPRAKYNFNSDWKLLVGDPPNAEAVGFDDSRWQAVTTPHAWNEDDAFKKDIRDLSTGIAWYRKH